MAFFVAVILLFQFSFGWEWYLAAVVIQALHMALVEHRFREVQNELASLRLLVSELSRIR